MNDDNRGGRRADGGALDWEIRALRAESRIAELEEEVERLEEEKGDLVHALHTARSTFDVIRAYGEAGIKNVTGALK